MALSVLDLVRMMNIHINYYRKLISGLVLGLILWLSAIAGAHASPQNQTIPTMPSTKTTLPTAAPSDTPAIVEQPTEVSTQARVVAPTQTASMTASPTSKAAMYTPSKVPSLTKVPGEMMATVSVVTRQPTETARANLIPTQALTPTGETDLRLYGFIGGGVLIVVIAVGLWLAQRKRQQQ